MSSKATMKVNEQTSQTVLPSRGLTPKRRLSPLQQVDEVAASRNWSPHDTFGKSGFSHDFGQVRVHADQVKSSRATQQAPDWCPLGLTTPRACPFGGACHACPAPIQAKLTINQPKDRYEREADRVAEQVMRMPEPRMQRQVEPEGEKESVQTKQADGQTPDPDPSLRAKIHSLKGHGQPLPDSTRQFFEDRIGHDFSQVRVHTDADSADMAQNLNAQAFTVGHDIVFGARQYVPESDRGRRLLSHELIHVVQQERPQRLQRSQTAVVADTISVGGVSRRGAVIQRHVFTPPREREFSPLPDEVDELENTLENTTPLLRNLYRGMRYHPWFYRPWLLEALAVSEIPDISSMPSGGYSPTDAEFDRIIAVAFSLLSSQEELARDMGHLPAATANRFQLHMAQNILFTAIEYVRRNPSLWDEVTRQRQRRERQRGRYRERRSPRIREPEEATL